MRPSPRISETSSPPRTPRWSASLLLSLGVAGYGVFLFFDDPKEADPTTKVVLTVAGTLGAVLVLIIRVRYQFKQQKLLPSKSVKPSLIGRLWSWIRRVKQNV
jgi:peptidoglycan/LPS O-acetylase OafA/YrhL